MSLSKVVAVARGEIGKTEWPPGSNITPYGEAYGLNGVPWCLQFLWWVFREAGESSAFFGGAKTASCGTFLKWYQEQGQTVPVSGVQPGDVVILNFDRTKETQHCGYVTNVVRNKGKSNGYVMSVQTIEGNTSIAGSQSNGGMVCEKTRYPYQMVGVCRIQYKEEEPVITDIKPDYTDHWAKMAILWAKDKGISNGYPDGMWRPDQQITRAEAVTMLYRYNDVVQKELTELRQEIARLKEANT